MMHSVKAALIGLLFFCIMLFFANKANARKIMNMDKSPRTINVTQVGNIQEKVVLQSGESYWLYGPYFEISIPNQQPVVTDSSREYVIKNNELILMGYHDNKSRR